MPQPVPEVFISYFWNNDFGLVVFVPPVPKHLKPRELGGGCKGQNWLNCVTRYFDRDEYRNRDVYTLIYPYTELDLNQS